MPPTNSPRYIALLQLLHTAETLWNGSRIFFAQWDLSPSQFNILNVLVDDEQGLTQVELSRRLIMHRSNVTGLVDRLEKRGLIARNANPDDRRVHHVVLTASGRKLLNEILPHYYRAAEQIWDKFSVKRAKELAADLETLALNVEEFIKRAKLS